MALRAAAAAVSASLLLGACSTAQEMLQGKKIDYKSAGQLPSLEIPPDLTAPARDNRYVVPESGKAATTYSAYDAQRGSQPRTGAASVLPSIEKMRVERSGSQRWLVISEPPEKLWPLVKDFWQEAGFLINRELPDAGVMETDWAENRAKLPQDFIRQTIGKLLDQVYSTSERDKFRTRLERGAVEGTTEIYVSHRGMVEVFNSTERMGPQGQIGWQPRPPDPELEAEFLRRLMVRLGAQEERAKELLVAAPQGLRATLTKQPDGADLLQVAEPFDRAWRRVGLALDRVGFTVEDRDRQKGLYFVRYADPNADQPKEKPGLLSRLAFWKSDDKALKTEQFHVLVKGSDDNSQVQVLGKDGSVDKSKTSQRILSLLHEQLK
jgi:outer membrane protein assembly factor BamC